MTGPTFVLVGDGHPAAETLKHLLSRGAQVIAAYATAGQMNRGALTRLAEKAGVPLLDSADLKSRPVAVSDGVHVDWILNINSTVLLPDHVLQAARAGSLNMHPGLLPEYAGLHTHQWAIRNGETVFGITVHEMVPSVDAGDIVHSPTFEIEDSDTGLSLYLKCMEVGLEGFRRVIDLILSGTPLPRVPQDLSRRTLYRHKDAIDGIVDWRLAATDLERFVRAGTYAPLSSPSYTPTLRLSAGRDATVLELGVAHLAEGEGGLSGQVLQGPGGQGPRVVCGDGTAVCVRRIVVDDKELVGSEVDPVIVPGQRLPTKGSP
ncbi:MAG: methionyl-tRNA formyltransferase [Longimicrobiales bacterium]